MLPGPFRIPSFTACVAALAAFLLAPNQVLADGYVITTVAGGNPFIGSVGNGDLATNAYLNSPAGVAVDAAGNIYIADTGNHAVRKVGADGVITAFAGLTGNPGLSGDGGPATAAKLRGPTGLAVDKAGNLYICDTSNNRIRKVDSKGVITTVAGSDTVFSSGVGDGGTAVNANLSLPRGVLPDASGNLYIADTGNHRVRKVDANGIITTFAGNGTTSNGAGTVGDGASAVLAVVGPAALALDATGNLHIADSLNHLIRKVSGGNITSVAGIGLNGYSGDGALAIKATLNQPQGLVIDASGNIFIADSGNMVIRKVGTDGNISTVAGNGDYGSYGDGGPAGAAQLSDPTGLALANNGRIYIAGSSSSGYKDARIRVLIPTGSGTAPTISTNGVVPIYGTATTIQPGSWISIYGTNLAPTTAVWNGDFPNALGQTAVTIDGKPAFLWYVSPTQINAQAPDDTYAGAVYVTVTTPSGTAVAVVTLGLTAPSMSLATAKYPVAIVLTPNAPGNSGKGYDFIGPSGSLPYASRPAVAGETVILYGVGFGATVPAVPAGQAYSGSAPLTAYPSVTIGDIPCNVTYAGLVQAGLYQLNVQVPAAGSGDKSLVVSAGGVNAQGGLFLTLK